MSAALWSIRAFGTHYDVRAFPSRPFRTVKTFRNDNGSAFAVNAKGHFFSTMVKGSQRHYGHGRPDGECITILEGIAALGALPANKVAALKAERQRYQAEENRAYYAEQLEDNASELGVVLTAAQRRKVVAFKKGGK